MKLISMKICPYVQQVRVLLEAKKVKYDVEHIESDRRPEWLLDASPDGGEVPALVTDDGEILFQSDSIVQFIDETIGEPSLIGNAVEKARDRAWGYLASDNYLVQCSTQRSPDEGSLKERMEDLAPIFSHMENQVEGRSFRSGHLTMVDVSWFPMLHRSALIAERSGYDFLGAYPKLRAWREGLLGTGWGETSVPEDFKEVFTGFYLLEERYLGRLTA